jgi:hypothetical protein
MKRVLIDQFNLGGLSDSKYMGRTNSLASMVGLDIHSSVGSIFSQWKMVKDSGTTIDSWVGTILETSDGNAYCFSQTTGKIWKRTSAGVYSLVYTSVPSAGDAKCLHAAEFNGYVYWATPNKLFRITIAGLTDWATNAVEWKTFTNADNSYHPMVELNGILFIGDGKYVAQVDEFGNFSANALDLPAQYRIKCMGKVYSDLLIGTYTTDNVSRAHIFRWNTYSPSWSTDDWLMEIGINAFLHVDNHIIVNAGFMGNLYYYDGRDLQLFKTIPGVYSDTALGVVEPNAVANYQGLPVFGFGQKTGNPGSFGVYVLGRRNASYPEVLDLSFPIVPTTTVQTSNLTIGAISASDKTLLVSWRDVNTNTYGISKLDYTTRLSGAYFDTRVINLERENLENFKHFIVNYEKLPSGTSIQLYYNKNHTFLASEEWTELTTKNDTDRKKIYADNVIRATTVQFRVKLNTTGISTPIIESGVILLE